MKNEIVINKWFAWRPVLALARFNYTDSTRLVHKLIWGKHVYRESFMITAATEVSFYYTLDCVFENVDPVVK